MSDKSLDLNGIAIMEARGIVREYLGVGTAFFDDTMRLVAVLAQRAVLAGLASDADAVTLAKLEAAAEPCRHRHESALGFPITKVPRP